MKDIVCAYIVYYCCCFLGAKSPIELGRVKNKETKKKVSESNHSIKVVK